LEAHLLIFASVSVTARPSCPIASSVRSVLVFASRSTLALRVVSASLSRSIRACATGFSPTLISLRVLPSVRTSSVRFRRFASTSLDGRSIFDITASVIVATVLSTKLSIRMIATSARIAATITRIAVALIRASRNSTGSLRSRAEIPFRSGSDKNASCDAALRRREPGRRSDHDHKMMVSRAAANRRRPPSQPTMQPYAG
jgi:hypothetical protein